MRGNQKTKNKFLNNNLMARPKRGTDAILLRRAISRRKKDR